jgi:hypothetical protein
VQLPVSTDARRRAYWQQKWPYRKLGDLRLTMFAWTLWALLLAATGLWMTTYTGVKWWNGIAFFVCGGVVVTALFLWRRSMRRWSRQRALQRTPVTQVEGSGGGGGGGVNGGLGIAETRPLTARPEGLVQVGYAVDGDPPQIGARLVSPGAV